jgi:hypothetical protein
MGLPPNAYLAIFLVMYVVKRIVQAVQVGIYTNCKANAILAVHLTMLLSIIYVHLLITQNQNLQHRHQIRVN